nr:universal stress protein [uncultured Desulfobacter sp.]
MNKKILIAFDDSENAQKTVSFIAKHFTTDHEITFFHVVTDIAAVCGMDSPSLTPYFNSERNSFCRIEERKKKIIMHIVDEAKTKLLHAQFNADKIEVKIQTQQKGVAPDIIKEAENGYDIVAMGRAAKSGIKEFLMGGTTQKVLHGLKNTPLLIFD